MTAKPTVSEGLGRVWSNTGGRTDPDTVTPGKVAGGWSAEIPPFQFFNWAQHFTWKMCNHVNVEGVPLWDSATVYNLHSYVKSAVNGNMYRSNIANNSGNEPSVSVQWDIFDSAGASDTDELTNASSVTGATCSDALNNLQSGINTNATNITALDSSDIDNSSGVSGSNVTAAMNNLNTTLNNLTSNNIANASTVTGATVTNALNNLRPSFTSKSSSQTIPDSGTFETITELGLPLEADTLYRFFATIIYSASPDAGATFFSRFVGPAQTFWGVAITNNNLSPPGTTANSTGRSASLNLLDADIDSAPRVAIISGVVKSPTAGNFIYEVESEGPGTVFTIHQNSTVMLTKL